MSKDEDWAADLRRYAMRRPFLKEQSIWPIWLYRRGRRIDGMAPGLGRRLATALYWSLYRVIETASGITLPKSARVGPGLRIWHFGNVIIHSDAVIGANCTLRHGVTIGTREENGPVPVIGDDADIGAYAQILGGVRVGNGCRIGAMSVVLCDVPDGATAVGAPARIIAARRDAAAGAA
ncbi:serine acetyltransferase [Duganella dendranthematis]|jgi:serine O-acetyltransferase|uniref:Serine acetyltransferase n=1 Tax=Duganella dendranthematis TaxID=2728021 RepID=A0ABX6MD44_9BURK|nr:serine acetyltransferase [Duganella dendranthematis]QJD92086.1 serine acetyltransferase [Duganella dendranthematis]